MFRKFTFFMLAHLLFVFGVAACGGHNNGDAMMPVDEMERVVVDQTKDEKMTEMQTEMEDETADETGRAPAEPDPPPMACIPNCDDATCGPDGCGGVCGPGCPDGQPCVNGQCQRPQPWLTFRSPIGYGRNATGGRDGRVCQVTNLNDDGDGSLRDCTVGNEAKWVVFAVDGTITLQSPIVVGSNTTIDGRNRRITLTNRGLLLSRVQNIIVHGIRIEDGVRGDAIRIVNESRDIWIDHVTLKNFDDGLIDITRESTAVTVSWCHFRDHRKVMLLGADQNDEGDRIMRVTIHHNWFERTNSRHPRVRYGRVHIYNNYFDRWGHYAVGISQRAEAYIEHNVFQADDDNSAIITQVGEDPERGRICTTHNRHLNGSREAEEDCDGFRRPDYPYSHDDDLEDVADIVKNGAGAP